MLLNKTDIHNLQDLKNYASKQNDIFNIADWIMDWATDNVIKTLGVISGDSWRKALSSIPKDLRGGDDFTQYYKDIKYDSLFDAQECQDTADDPAGYEINQYPKSLTLKQIKSRINKATVNQE